MPDSQIQVKNGAVSLPAGYVLDAQAWSVRESQAVEDTTAFGSQKYCRYLGTGTPMMSGTVSGFAKKGSTSNNPGFGAAASTSVSNDIGISATFTVDTGITIVTPVIVNEIAMSVSRIRPGAPVTISWTATPVGTTDVVTTWA